MPTGHRSAYGNPTELWETPQALFDELDAEFLFDLDACALPGNAKVDRYITPEQDALRCDWPGRRIYMNPPYGRGIGKWVERAHEMAMRGGRTVVCLLPASTDTRWFHDRCLGAEIRFLPGRLKFTINGRTRYEAPFPSMVVIFRGAAS